MFAFRVDGYNRSPVLFNFFYLQTSVKRMGRWIDFKNDYKTLYPWFMETVWYVYQNISQWEQESYIVWRLFTLIKPVWSIAITEGKLTPKQANISKKKTLSLEQI